MDTEFEKELAAAEYTLDSLKDYDRAYKSFEQISALHPENCRCWFGMLRAVTQDFGNYGIPIEQVGGLIKHTLHTAAEGEKGAVYAKIRTYLEARKKAQSEKCAKAESENTKYHTQKDRAPVILSKINMLNTEIEKNNEKGSGFLNVLSYILAFLFAFMAAFTLGPMLNSSSYFEKIGGTLFCAFFFALSTFPFVLRRRRNKKTAEMIQRKAKLEEEYNGILRSDFVSDEELQQMQSEIAAIDRLLLNL